MHIPRKFYLSLNSLLKVLSVIDSANLTCINFVRFAYSSHLDPAFARDVGLLSDVFVVRRSRKIKIRYSYARCWTQLSASCTKMLRRMKKQKLPKL